ncbi:hypothetical protein SOPP22_16470 [Shewanella sp. OPT22]|nr:hypothetical protein SOPP22_16470 [Shewanella sp. OPT22]
MLERLTPMTPGESSLSGRWFYDEKSQPIGDLSIAEHRESLAKEVISVIQLHPGQDKKFSCIEGKDANDVANFLRIGTGKLVNTETGEVGGLQHKLLFQGEEGQKFYDTLTAFSPEITKFSEHVGELIAGYFTEAGPLHEYKLGEVRIEDSVPIAFRFPKHIPDFDITVTHKESGKEYSVTDNSENESFDVAEVMPGNEVEIIKNEDGSTTTVYSMSFSATISFDETGQANFVTPEGEHQMTVQEEDALIKAGEICSNELSKFQKEKFPALELAPEQKPELSKKVVVKSKL